MASLVVFSLDSVITAVGMVVAVGVMLVSAKSIGTFEEKQPTVKILASLDARK